MSNVTMTARGEHMPPVTGNYTQPGWRVGDRRMRVSRVRHGTCRSAQSSVAGTYLPWRHARTQPHTNSII